MFVTRFLCAISLALLPGLCFSQTALKLGHPQANTSAFQVGAQAFADEFAKRTHGRYRISVFPGGALGGERELIEKTQIGTLDLALTSTGPVGHFVPDTLITDIPFLFRDYEHARRVLDGPIGQAMLSKFPGKGLIALAWGENGFRHLSNNKRAVHTPEDLKGLKLRTMENQVHITAFKVLGTLPTPMSFTDLYTAMKVGTVDGEENPIPVILSGRFGEVQKHLSLTGHVYSPALFLASPDMFNRLSDADKKSMLEAARHGATMMRKRVNEVEANGIEELKAQGVTVVTSVDKTRFQSALAPAYSEYAKKFGSQNIDRIRNHP